MPIGCISPRGPGFISTSPHLNSKEALTTEEVKYNFMLLIFTNTMPEMFKHCSTNDFFICPFAFFHTNMHKGYGDPPVLSMHTSGARKCCDFVCRLKTRVCKIIIIILLYCHTSLIPRPLPTQEKGLVHTDCLRMRPFVLKICLRRIFP